MTAVKKGTEVLIEKFDSVEDPEHETPPWEEHNEGRSNPGSSLPEDYQAKGILAERIKKGAPIYMFRTERNDTKQAGLFRTSPVQTIEEKSEFVIAKTMNSVYRITEVGENI